MKDINVLGLFVRRVRFMYGSMFHTTAKPEGRIYHKHPEANQKKVSSIGANTSLVHTSRCKGNVFYYI